MFDFDRSSLDCAGSMPNRLLRSSRDAQWRSLLLDHHEGSGDSDRFETHPTSDVTLVVAVRGEHRIAVLKNGYWQGATYQPGAAGMTPSDETTCMRWNTRSRRDAFQTAHLYLPRALFASIREEYRRAGSATQEDSLSVLVFRDPVVESGARALIEALQAEAHDLYAEQAAHWLATHILAHHVGWWDMDEDRRTVDPLSDRRLTRAIEYMSASIDQPLRLDEIAREAGISVHHFGRLFRERTGETPAGYLLRIRMATARRLLNTTDLPIDRLAAACGYTRPAAFAAAFRRHLGVTPSDYREPSSCPRERSSPSREFTMPGQPRPTACVGPTNVQRGSNGVWPRTKQRS